MNWNVPPLPTVPCKTCGTPTQMLGTKLCDSCWEVESRLGGYLRSERGRAFASEALIEATHAAHERTKS